MKIKKILSLIFAVFILLGAIIPTTNAAKWHISSVDKTFFEIPPDDRNLRDFIFSDHIINYKHWSEKDSTVNSFEGKITTNMVWYKTIFNSNPTHGLKVITNEDIAPFFVVVDPFYYNKDGVFAFPIYEYYGPNYMYMYWKADEDQNFCLYLDYENKGEQVYKIKSTCHMQMHDRDPFLLFFQLKRTGYDIPNAIGSNATSFYISSEEERPYYEISITTTHKAKYKEKDYITFNVPEKIYLDVPGFVSHFYSPINGSIFKIDDNRVLVNTVDTKTFLRQANQRAFRPYSFFFEKYFTEKYNQRFNDEELKNKHCDSNYCQVTAPFDPTSFFESFVLSVSAQYYNSPAVTNDNTYIEVPDGIEGGGFQPYNECSGFLDVGCHISNVGISISNGFKMFLNGFIEGIKGIFSFIWDSIKGFFEPIVKPIWEEIKNIYKSIEIFFNDIYKILINLFKGGTDPTTEQTQKLTPGSGFRNASATQKLLCDKEFILINKENIEEKEGMFGIVLNTLKAGFGIFGIIDPIAPNNGKKLCTYEGIKTLHLRNNSFVDIILFLIFGSSLFLLFYRNS